jgi:molecular chaperone HscB
MHLRLLPSLSRALRPATTAATPTIRPIARGQRRPNSTTSSLHRCPQCGASLPTYLPLCTACSFIAPIQPSTSSRDLLLQNLEPGQNPFVIDGKALRNAFLRAQQVCHPDAWATAPPQAQRLAGEYSARINKAYRTLSSPRARAEEILEQHGRDTKEHDQLDDPELVMRIMEVRERIEEGDEAAKEQIVRENQGEFASFSRIKAF